MKPSTKLALAILLVSLALGVLGDVLLRATPWGLNAALFIGALTLLLLAVAAWHNVRLTGGGRWLLLPAVIFAAGFAWRDSFALQTCNFLAVLIALALVADRAARGRVRVAGFVDYVGAMVLAGIHAAFSVLSLIFGDIQWKSVSAGQARTGQLASIGLGLGLALPVVAVFGGLLASADAVFDQLARDLFNWDVEQLISHAMGIGAWTWVVGGFLRQTFLARETRFTSAGAPVFSLGITEIGLALGALNVLFLAFVLIQFRYLFGGAEALRAVSGLSYSEYARRGFFELVEVAALVLPLLLLAHWLLKKERAAHVRVFNGLAATTIGLLFIIMLSAVLRMKLYTDEFGLTELRLYTTAFMAWLALVFLWFGATVLRGQRERFIFGALMAGFVVLIGLQALNPDQLIVRVNAQRSSATPFDAEYPTHLSADAVPALIAALPAMTEADRCAVAAWLVQQWSPPAYFDPLTWNWGRWQAWQAVTAQQNYLQAVACPASRS